MGLQTISDIAAPETVVWVGTPDARHQAREGGAALQEGAEHGSELGSVGTAVAVRQVGAGCNDRSAPGCHQRLRRQRVR